MPRGDGTGPTTGQGTGIGQGRGRFGSQERMSDERPGFGPGGECICPACGIAIPHHPGMPCNTQICSKCGARMKRI